MKSAKNSSNTMVKLALTLSALCATGAPSAMAAGRPAEQSDQIAAQVQVTHDTLQQVLTKMKNNPGPGGEISNPDFIAKADAFNREAERAMVKFENDVNENVLKQAAFYINRLNAIQKSYVYTADQKKALLTDQILLAKVIFNDLSKKYAAAIYELYTIGMPKGQLEWKGGEPYFIGYGDDGLRTLIARASFRVRFEELGIPLQDVEGTLTVNGTPDWNTEFFSNLQFYRVHFPQFREAIFSRVVRDQCFTSSCVALFADHRISYVNLIKQDIDVPISFKLGDLEIKIDALRFMKEELISYLRLRAGDSANLPFDMSESEYSRAAEEARVRTAKVDELKRLLQTPSSNGYFGSKWKCPTQVRQVKIEICSLKSGCLSNSESSAIEDLINRGESLMNKAERLSCLQAT